MQISERRAKTRERLADAALEVFAERGILASSVEEICERAGFTRGAFYSNFTSKDDLCLVLFRRIGQEHLQVARAAIEEILKSGNLDRDRVAEPAAYVLERMHRPDRTTALFLSEVELYAARTPEFAEPYRVFDSEISASFAEVMRTAVGQVGMDWTIPEPDAQALLKLVDHKLRLEWLSTGTFDREHLLRLLRPLLGALLVPR